MGEFAGLMAAVGPFERAPVVAAAVSGGADSLALCLLAVPWARRRRGRVVALSVDHGLRPESGSEARRVGRWLEAHGVEHHVLRWRGDKPGRGVQAAARAARYGLLTGWCRRRGVLHLLLAHHLEDQAETLIMRLGRGSGVDGLAAMAPVSEGAGVRLLRPLLGVSRARLVALLESRGQAWLEDPANQDPTHLRTRVRRALDLLGPEGFSPARLAATAARLGRARAALEMAATALLAEAATVHPAGFCRLDPAPLVAAPGEVGLRALGRVLMCVGGRAYPLRLERLERLYRALGPAGLEAPRTLAGCRIMPWSGQGSGRVLVCREPAAAAGALTLAPGREGLWDGRFAVRRAPSRGAAARRMEVRRLGRAGWTEVAKERPDLRASAIPAPVRPSLPSLRDIDGVVSVPHLGYYRTGAEGPGAGPLVAMFRPAVALAPATFAII